MVCKERMSRGILTSNEWQEQSNGMSESQGWCWMESGGDSAGQRSKENGQVGDSG